MRRTFIGLISLTCVTFLTPGCLIKETSQTIYLEPDGRVTWTVLEKDVRSDGEKAEDRTREEAEYFSAASGARHPIALAFASLDPISVRAAILRAVPPYAVFTDARFARLDSLMARFVERIGVRPRQRSSVMAARTQSPGR